MKKKLIICRKIYDKKQKTVRKLTENWGKLLTMGKYLQNIAFPAP